jgi:drug/metabolite transporter (DMT)-like permease
LQRRFLPEIILVSIAFIWGVTFVIVQDAIQTLPPYSFLAIRFLLSFILLWLINKFYIKEKIWDRSTMISGVILGIFLFLGFALQTYSLLYTTSGKAGFFTGMNVVFVPIVALLLLRQPIKKSTLIGIICSVVGLYFLSGSIVGMNVGDVLSLGCAVAFAFQIALTGRYVNKESPYALVIWQLITVTICSGIMAFCFETVHPAVLFNPIVWTAILITSVLATVFAFVAQTIVQKKIPASRVAIIFTLEPVFAALGDYVKNSIILSSFELIGCAVIIGGILLAEIPWKKQISS